MSYIVRWQTAFGGFSVRNLDARTACHLGETLLCAEQVRVVSIQDHHNSLIGAFSKGTKLEGTFTQCFKNHGIEIPTSKMEIEPDAGD